jgi:hypothetical protein
VLSRLCDGWLARGEMACCGCADILYVRVVVGGTHRVGGESCGPQTVQVGGTHMSYTTSESSYDAEWDSGCGDFEFQKVLGAREINGAFPLRRACSWVCVCVFFSALLLGGGGLAVFCCAVFRPRWFTLLPLFAPASAALK